MEAYSCQTAVDQESFYVAQLESERENTALD